MVFTGLLIVFLDRDRRKESVGRFFVSEFPVQHGLREDDGKQNPGDSGSVADLEFLERLIINIIRLFIYFYGFIYFESSKFDSFVF